MKRKKKEKKRKESLSSEGNQDTGSLCKYKSRRDLRSSPSKQNLAEAFVHVVLLLLLMIIERWGRIFLHDFGEAKHLPMKL
jgi:hypothetical protein